MQDLAAGQALCCSAGLIMQELRLKVVLGPAPALKFITLLLIRKTLTLNCSTCLV
jgi:hypothetical protein